jgi:tetratricopeptide (TPR) repeat protein
MAEDDQSRASGYEPNAALFAAALGAASGARNVDALIERQIAIADLQIEDMRREDSVRHWSLRVHHISDVLKLAFQLALAVIFSVFVFLIAWVIWSAAHDNSLVIDAFKVPPDMAAKGLTGDVVASQMLDRLIRMQNQTDSSRAPSTYASDWGGDIKVEIPDTGVSIGQAYKYLAAALGHQTHISGEVWRTPGGIALTARVGGNPGATFTGTEADLPKLTQSAAESIYHQTQPYRYAIYVGSTAPTAALAQSEQDAVLGDLALTGPDSEKPWAYSVWTYSALARNDMREALRRANKAVALAPDLPMATENLAEIEHMAGHEEKSLAAARATLRALDGSGRNMIIPRAAAVDRTQANAFLAEEQGDYAEALRQYQTMRDQPDFEGVHWNSVYMTAADLALLHDIKASRAVDGAKNDLAMARQMNQAFGWQLINLGWPVFLQDAAREDWSAALRDMQGLLVVQMRTGVRMGIEPSLALADTKAGDFAAAWKVIGKTPSDCYRCVLMRAQIAMAQKNWAQAQNYFAQADKLAPSIPFADTDWGAMLLGRGDLDGAIAKFESANQKGPHFADPLEMWGEALIRENRSDLALAKFEEADKYAPNWGRLHLKWGEALWWSGDKDGARKQFAAAAGLDMTPSEKSELVRVNHV